ncbi:hypothetical protein [Phytohabitans aurantiacus]|uniref:Uncharacterized protein n=1 Tax=Phytohabitans aurantiacus TaxID=3016789 RepID=A0ABQ5QRY2_9ACTN|nr:hypothetical protein [Phytohabitans aurantiacus]GLH96627.1 hypothetical protein Pa4123_19010 [Phytohabitans aurantiacus]
MQTTLIGEPAPINNPALTGAPPSSAGSALVGGPASVDGPPSADGVALPRLGATPAAPRSPGPALPAAWRPPAAPGSWLAAGCAPAVSWAAWNVVPTELRDRVEVSITPIPKGWGHRLASGT